MLRHAMPRAQPICNASHVLGKSLHPYSSEGFFAHLCAASPVEQAILHQASRAEALLTPTSPSP